MRRVFASLLGVVLASTFSAAQVALADPLPCNGNPQIQLADVGYTPVLALCLNSNVVNLANVSTGGLACNYGSGSHFNFNDCFNYWQVFRWNTYDYVCLYDDSNYNGGWALIGKGATSGWHSLGLVNRASSIHWWGSNVQIC